MCFSAWAGYNPSEEESHRILNRKGRQERREKQARLDENQLSQAIIGAAIEVHRHLGPGLLESAYEASLAYELTQRAIPFERQKTVGVIYKGISVDCGFRVDLLASQLVIIEIKAVEHLAPIHEAQVLTYLKLTRCKLGLLLNFNERLMRDGIQRVVLGL